MVRYGVQDIDMEGSPLCVYVCAYTNASGAVWGTGYRHERGGGVCVFILCSFFVYSLFYPMTPPLRTRFLLLQMPYCSPCVCLGFYFENK